MKIGIIGLGLIGGSMGFSLKKSGFADYLYGYDNNEEHGQQALERGIIDKVCQSVSELVQQCDLIVMAMPVQHIESSLPELLDLLDHQTVTDVGSTKNSIIKGVQNHPKRSQYVASHPMAGTEYSGPQAAICHLFEDKTCVLCDIEDSLPASVAMVEKMYTSIGMNIVYYNAVDHDIHTAYVSHISHISSFALALTVLEKEKNANRIFELASGGFSSTVRLAKSNPDTWVPIFKLNRDNVLDVLDEHINTISQFRTLLIKKDFTTFHQLIEKANNIQKILK